MEEHTLKTDYSFPLESGSVIPNLTIRYHTMGKLNQEKNNVIWICHALTANSDVSDWWPGMVGKGKIFDPDHYYIICANIIGSCYGTTGPLSINQDTCEPFYHDFPLVTIRDMIKAHELLRNHLQIKRIHLITGGSIGGFQAIEWALHNPDIFDNVALMATGVETSPWAVAFNETQRMAIRTDPSFQEKHNNAGIEGMKTARSVALLSYRNYNTYRKTQSNTDKNIMEGHRAVTYQQYQGEKLAGRFNAFSYYAITRAFDSHNIFRNRNKNQFNISPRVINISIDTDILFPKKEQDKIKEAFPDSHVYEINSLYGHDGFLLENHQLTKIFTYYLNKTYVSQ